MKILITGATSGIGYSLGVSLASKNNYVYLCSKNKLQNDKLKDRISDNSNIECIKLDITNKNDVLSLEKMDIDVLVCCTGVGYSGSIVDADIELLKNNFNINVFSNVKVINAVLKNMIKKKNGKVIIISSLLAKMPIKFFGYYSSSKAALLNLGSCLNKELKYMKSNIKTYVVLPGAYKTGFNQLMIENNNFKKVKNLNINCEEIINKEYKFFNLIERKNLNSVVKKIEKLIFFDSKRLVHYVPFFQGIICKFYNFFKL